VKRLTPADRPREKLVRLGLGALGDNELLALVLGTGHGDADALELANAVLTFVGGLHGLTRTHAGVLRQVRGIGRVRAAQTLAAVELGRRSLIRGSGERVRLSTPRQLAAYLLPLYGSRAVEQFGIVLLDSKHRVIHVSVLSTGTLDQTVVHPREVFREASCASAAAIALFHNHPSGDPTPSADDLALTARLVSAGDIMGIAVIDHVILADERYLSLLEAGHLPLRTPASPGRRGDAG
jgi:DNA repair protein RadC